MRKKPATNGLDNCGGVIRDLRNQHDWSQEQLAAAIGDAWDRTRVNKIERGAVPITRSAIHQFAIAFRMRPEALYLKCLEVQYPALRNTEIGILLEQIISRLGEDQQEDCTFTPPMAGQDHMLPRR